MKILLRHLLLDQVSANTNQCNIWYRTVVLSTGSRHALQNSNQCRVTRQNISFGKNTQIFYNMNVDTNIHSNCIGRFDISSRSVAKRGSSLSNPEEKNDKCSAYFHTVTINNAKYGSIHLTQSMKWHAPSTLAIIEIEKLFRSMCATRKLWSCNTKTSIYSWTHVTRIKVERLNCSHFISAGSRAACLKTGIDRLPHQPSQQFVRK